MWVVNHRSDDDDAVTQTNVPVKALSRHFRGRMVGLLRRAASRGELARVTRDGARHKTLRLDGAEFVRRFLLHVLPHGLMRIRHFGFLANRCRHSKLARIRQALAAATAEVIVTDRGAAPSYPCPQCQQGRLHVIAQLPPYRPPWEPPGYIGHDPALSP